jgi:serine/threonine-protein kinase
MSPEQRHTTDYLTPPSDVYALGLLLFEMLTGRVYRNVRPGTRPLLLRSTVPIWLDDLVVRMLAERLEDRPFDGFEVASLLRHRQSEESAPQLEPSLAWEPVEPSTTDPSHVTTPPQPIRLPHLNPNQEPEPPLGWAPLE